MKHAVILSAALALSACRTPPPREPPSPGVSSECRRAIASELASTPLDDALTWRCGAPAECCPARSEDGALSLSLVAVSEPYGEWSHMLSGVWFDRARNAFLAVRDNDPGVVWMRPDPSWAHWTGGHTGISVWPHGSLEAISGLGDGLVIADEEEGNVSPPGPHLFTTTLADAGVDASPRPLLRLPERLARACENSGLESVSVSPDGRTLIAAMERALSGDDAGTSRVIVRDLASGAQRQVAWRLGPDCWRDERPSDLGVSDLVALSADHALVLERSWRREGGSCARIYLADLSRGEDVTAVTRLSRETRAAPKRLVLDLATLPRDVGLEPAAGQTHPVLGNYEGMALGPCMADGRRSVLLVTDDNEDSVRMHAWLSQARRALVLGARGL